MAKRFTQPSINWAELEKRVPADQRTQYFAFKGKSDGYLRRVLANPPEPPKIEWDQYKKTVPIPGLVDKLKQQYEAFKVPFPEDKLTAEIDKQWSSLQGQIKSFCDERQKDIDQANKSLEKMKAIPRYEDMTMEMYSVFYPDRALDPVNKPTFWPHDAEEQLGYKPEEPVVEKKEKK